VLDPVDALDAVSWGVIASAGLAQFVEHPRKGVGLIWRTPWWRSNRMAACCSSRS
jgi:hypothetical protein